VAFFRSLDARAFGEDGVLAEACEFIGSDSGQNSTGGPVECGRDAARRDRRLPLESDRQSDRVAELVRWSDVAWFDGGGEMAVEASGWGTIPGSSSVCDARTCEPLGEGRPMGEREHSRPDRCPALGLEGRCASGLSVGSPVEDMLLEQVPDIHNRARLVVVPTGLTFAATRCAAGTGQASRLHGCLTTEANPAFLIQCMQKLHYIDPGYRLSFAGTFEGPLLEQYLLIWSGLWPGGRRHVRTVIRRDESLAERQAVHRAPGSAKPVEPCCRDACGLKPVIHNFPGADKLFPQRHLFNIAEQFCEKLVLAAITSRSNTADLSSSTIASKSNCAGSMEFSSSLRPRSNPMRGPDGPLRSPCLGGPARR